MQSTRSTAQRYDERLEICHPAEVKVAALAEMPPGQELISRLHALRGEPMTGSTAIKVAGLWQKCKSWCEAESMIPVATALDWRESLPSNDLLSAIPDVGDELAAETNLSTTTATNLVSLVAEVNERLSLSWEALDRGEWTLAHLRAFANATRNATPSAAMAVEAVIVPAALAQCWTPHQVKKETATALVAIDPDGASERAKKAREDDNVEFYSGHDETATINATGSALSMREMMDAIEALARRLGEDGDARPIGQRRITAMRMLILGETAATIGAGTEVVVAMDINVLAAFRNGVAEVSGYGPITAETARTLMADAAFRRMITDPLTGDLIDLGTTRYRPSEALLRFVMTRDGTCAFPGCSRAARNCDCDHVINHPIGGTDRHNLHMLCRRHHNQKTHGGWTVVRNLDGSEVWTSRFGLSHTRWRPAYEVAPVYPPNDDHLSDDADRDLLNSDPDPPQADDPLPEEPTISLEDYFEFTDDLERAAIIGANKHHDAFYRSGHAA
jgi:hypothetical protein